MTEVPYLSLAKAAKERGKWQLMMIYLRNRRRVLQKEMAHFRTTGKSLNRITG